MFTGSRSFSFGLDELGIRCLYFESTVVGFLGIIRRKIKFRSVVNVLNKEPRIEMNKKVNQSKWIVVTSIQYPTEDIKVMM